MIATPLVDTKGPLAAYTEVNKALQREGVFEDIPLRRIFLKSPRDPVLRSLERQSRAVPHETFRIINEPIAGSFVEDAYIYTGSVHIVQFENSRGIVPDTYSVIYAPYTGPGGAVPAVKITGIEQLRDFLVRDLHIDVAVVDGAIRELAIVGSTSIPNAQFRPAELRRLGLA
jgi:hypothetical protein